MVNSSALARAVLYYKCSVCRGNAFGVCVAVAVRFSERYLTWYVYHGITQDDVKKGKVRASQVGEGYDAEETDSQNPNSAFLMGGASLSGMNLFAAGFGPVDETTEVKGEYPYAYSDKNIINNEDFEDYSADGDWSIPLNAEYRNAPIKAVLRNGNLLPCGERFRGELRIQRRRSSCNKIRNCKGSCGCGNSPCFRKNEL